MDNLGRIIPSGYFFDCVGNKIGIFKPFLWYCILAISFASCEKSSLNGDPPTPKWKHLHNLSTQTGWLGSENSATIPNDPMLFSGTPPAKIDLTPYMPPVGNQGNLGTCVAWACGYYQRTAMQGIRNNLTGSQLADFSRQFSPKDLFWSIPNNNKGADCNGTHFEYALDQLQKRGVATMQTVPYQDLGNCSSLPVASWSSEANNYKIQSYRELPITVNAIKAKLAEKRPLVFGAIVTESFGRWRESGVMRNSSILDGTILGGHAMTIVGYDDALNAFRIVNSWGKAWGDGGYAWVDYDLITNTEFTNCIFAAYDASTSDPVNPGTSVNGINIAMSRLEDRDNGVSDPSKRLLIWNLKNTGNTSVQASKDWHILYMYVNAYDIEDYGVIQHQYITNDYGTSGEQGPYAQGLGYSSNNWANVTINPGETLAEAWFGSSTEGIATNFTMPPINGFYYMVMIADAFEDLEEEYLYDNLYFLYNSYGGPIHFINGVGQGLKSEIAEDRTKIYSISHTAVNKNNLNAYRPDEIRQYLLERYHAKQIPTGMGNTGEFVPSGASGR